jgi:hypothetical protein
VVIGIAFGRGAMVVLLANVEFAADDWLHSMLMCCIDEVDGAENVAMVGHSHGGHTHFAYMLTEFFDVTGAIEQGVVSVQVQVDELRHGLSLV